MRNLFKTIAYVEHVATRGLARQTAVPEKKPKPSVRVWRAPTTDVRYPEQVFKQKDKPMTKLDTRALKVTAVLDAAVVATLPTPDGQSRSDLVITCEGQTYTANIATKSLRKVKTTIAANGAANTVVVVQGKLKGNEIVECGLVAQVKTAKIDERSDRPPAATDLLAPKLG